MKDGPVVLGHIPPSSSGQPIFVLQSPSTRAMNVGYLEKRNRSFTFVPGRLNMGWTREEDTFEATIQSLSIPPVTKILKTHAPKTISTVTVLRETLACRLGSALAKLDIRSHYGDAFIGATHIKGDGPIRTAYLYENIEGLCPTGLWVIAESFCTGRNLTATMNSLLSKFHPKEILFIAPIASRLGINNVDAIIAKHHIPTTYLAWGALFGVDEKTLYDMPWGHPDTEPLDQRDQEVILAIYGKKFCMGGDFGNNYYCPALALKLYKEQLKSHRIKPKIPKYKEIIRVYSEQEILIR